ncbi:MAG: glycosyltransferase [Pirellulales bacterium]|nr:glycosyltransferase [Pirellulales bacterium]
MSKNFHKRTRLSVAMIVRDEQDAIGLTLESIRQIADEIVVADTGSQDSTPQIARQWGAKVHSTAWTDSFADARNSCLARATGDWVLWLDAGEQLSAASAKQLRDFVERGYPHPNNAYVLMVETPPMDVLASAEQIAQIRLMPRRAGLAFEGRIRENLLRSLTAAGMEIETAPGRILRHPRAHDSARKIARAERNLALIDLEKRADPRDNPRLLLAEGEALSDLDLNDRARDAYTRAIEISSPGSTAMLEGYYGLLSCYHSHPRLHDCQLEIGLKALETYPFDVQLLLAMGSYLQGKGRMDLASRAFEIAVKFGQVELAVWHLRELAEVAAACRCMILQLQGRTSEACDALEESLARHPRSARLLRHAVELSIKMDRPDKAVEFAGMSAADGENLPALADAVRGACRAAKTEWTAALGYLQGAYLAGCRHPLCLRWLTIALLGGGAIEAARTMLDEWRRAEPNHPEMLAYQEALTGARGPTAEEIASQTDGAILKERQYRLDTGVAAADTAHLGLSNLPQFNSFDAALPAENG